MRKTVIIAALALVLGIGVQAGVAQETDSSLDSEKQKISYALGYNIGRNLHNDYTVDVDAFFMGFKESAGEETTLTKEEMQAALMAFQTQMREKQAARMKVVADENKAEGMAFLAANKEKEGIKTLESGLQYRVLTAGEGASPEASDTVSCHYKGTTIDGKEFDSSYKRGQPASFQVSGVIPGWTEALQLMSVGSKWELFIPPDLAYGDAGAGQAIAPGSVLVFEVELLGIE